MAPDQEGKRDFWQMLGIATIIFALLSGVGACSLGLGIGRYYAGESK